jgi:hypothetical protein
MNSEKSIVIIVQTCDKKRSVYPERNKPHFFRTYLAPSLAPKKIKVDFQTRKDSNSNVRELWNVPNRNVHGRCRGNLGNSQKVRGYPSEFAYSPDRTVMLVFDAIFHSFIARK